MENKVKLSSFGSLFEGAIKDFKSRIKKIAALSAISIGVSFILSAAIAAAIAFGMMNVALGVLVGIIGFLVFLFATYFVNGAFVYLMKGEVSIKDSFKFIWKNIWPFFWIMVLTVLVTLPGIVALIIPGIFISILVSFAIFIFMDEGIKGMAALEKSREYVRGYFWAIVGRFTLYVLVIMGAAIAFSIVTGLFSLIHESIGSILQTVFNVFVLAPVGLCFSWRLYKDLKEKRPEVASVSFSGKKGWIKGLAIVGAAIVIASIILAISFGPEIKKAIEDVNSSIEQQSQTEDLTLDGETFSAEELEQLLNQ
jgi:uncharacterized membrane protein